ncbi:MAG TPA: anti-sigma factor [Thermomicrobiales bacterium]|nr:anti-sigma factor [Thermomicrobiales bacterium]
MADGTNDTIDARDEQLELYILGLLDERETAAIERVLRDDPAARQRARELREVVSVLALDVDPVEPSSGLKARILDAARADLTPDQVAPQPPISLAERRERGVARWTPWLVAAALALALAASLVWNAQLRSDLDSQPETAIYAVEGSGPAAGVAGSLIVVGDDDSVLTLAGLAALPSDRAYQVWLIADGAPVPNVTFVPNAAGVATVTVPGRIADYHTLAITVEPQTGSLAPTTDPIITSDLTVVVGVSGAGIRDSGLGDVAHRIRGHVMFVDDGM